MKVSGIIYAFLLLMLISLSSFSVEAGVAEADSAYAAGRYEDAMVLYSEVAEREGVSPELLFNLGNAASRAGDYGKAVIAYARARRLDPSDRTIAENLAYVRNKVEDANRAELKGKRASVSPEDVSFFRSVYNVIATNRSSNVWAGWAAACFIVGLACAAIYIFLPGVTLRKIGFFGGIGFVGISIVLLCFSYMAASHVESEAEAVLTDYKTPLLSRPDEGAKKSTAPLTRGTMLEVIETDTDNDGNPEWVHVRLNSDYSGWLKASQVEII